MFPSSPQSSLEALATIGQRMPKHCSHVFARSQDLKDLAAEIPPESHQDGGIDPRVSLGSQWDIPQVAGGIPLGSRWDRPGIHLGLSCRREQPAANSQPPTI